MNRPLIRFATTALIAALGITTALAGSGGGGTRIFVGESIPVVDKAIVKPAPQQQPKTKPQSASPASKPTQGSNSKPGPKPGSKPRPVEAAGVVYYTDGFELDIGQAQQAAQELQPLIEQVLQNMPSAEEIQELARQLQGPVTQQVEQTTRNMPSAGEIQEMARQLQGPVTQQVEQIMQNMPGAEEIQEMARQLQGPVTQQVEQTVQQLPQPMQEALNEPIIITPQSVNAGNSNGSKSKRRSNSKSKWTYGVPGMTGGDGNGPLIYNP
ncbi:MAG: hypothetical protein J6Y92_09170 [Lentisphaeria bacterium]|nr:hypothetical protein [Lentisphaeria bacterium]